MKANVSLPGLIAAQKNPLPGGIGPLAVGVLLVAVLYVGREVFVPVALAILLSFVLAPLIGILQRLRVPRGLAVTGVVLLAFVGISVLAGLMAAQVAELAGDLPRYQTTMREKIASLRGSAAGSGALERAADVLQDLGKELDKPHDSSTRPSNPLSTTPAAGPAGVKPIPVELRQADPGALRTIGAFITPLVQPLATTGIIVIFVIFILLQREDIRNRVIRLAGAHDLQKTTAALDDAAARLSRLFLVQLALNSAFGIVIGVGLWLIGVPSPVLWGILAAILRFVPYIGAFVAAAFPLVLAAAVDPGWGMLLWTIALFVIVEPVVGHVVEPLAYGHSTGLSPVAVVASATFWTWLWGPIGLVLATPLTVCLVVLGRHIESLEFLDVVLGNRPPLSPPELFYQRTLAGDPAETVDVAQEFLKERSLSTYYDEVALAGLRLAQIDAIRGVLDDTRLQRIRDTVDEIAADLSEYGDGTPSGDTINAEASAAVNASSTGSIANDLPILKKEDLAMTFKGENPVLCIAGRGPLDEAAAILLAQLLSKHGLSSRVESAGALSNQRIFSLDTSEVAIVCLSYFDATSVAHMRHGIRRIRRKAPGAQLMLGCWTPEEHPTHTEDLRIATKADFVATHLAEALLLCIQRATAPETEARQGAVVGVA